MTIVGTKTPKKPGVLVVLGLIGAGGRVRAAYASDLPERGLLVAFDQVRTDEQAPEDRLVHEAALFGVGCEVGRVAAFDERQGLIEGIEALQRDLRLIGVKGFGKAMATPLPALSKLPSVKSATGPRVAQLSTSRSWVGLSMARIRNVA